MNERQFKLTKADKTGPNHTAVYAQTQKQTNGAARDCGGRDCICSSGSLRIVIQAFSASTPQLRKSGALGCGLSAFLERHM